MHESNVFIWQLGKENKSKNEHISSMLNSVTNAKRSSLYSLLYWRDPLKISIQLFAGNILSTSFLPIWPIIIKAKQKKNKKIYRILFLFFCQQWSVHVNLLMKSPWNKVTRARSAIWTCFEVLVLKLICIGPLLFMLAFKQCFVPRQIWKSDWTLPPITVSLSYDNNVVAIVTLSSFTG